MEQFEVDFYGKKYLVSIFIILIGRPYFLPHLPIRIHLWILNKIMIGESKIMPKYCNEEFLTHFRISWNLFHKLSEKFAL